MRKAFEEGTVALVTGASSGIGRAIAVDLAENGVTVAINYNKNKEGAQETLRKVHYVGGKGAIIKADVSDEGEVLKMFMKIRKHFKRLDILVNNSGIIKDGFLLLMSQDSFENVLKTNLGGCFLCTKAAIMLMCSIKRGGCVINVASTSGIVGQEGQANYSASKGGIMSLTKTVAKEYAKDGIRVNCIAPGFVETAMTDVNKKVLSDKFMEFIPMKRFAKPEEIASVATFLASSGASYITGKIITVDGGLTM